MPAIRPALLALAAVAALAACGDARTVSGERGGECVSCHGFPPPPGAVAEAANHPQNGACYACHADTVDTSNAVIEDGAHLNGVAGDLRITGACNECHGFPPPPPHPNNTDCWVCHGTSVSASPPNSIIDPEDGGTHLNDVVDAGHPEGYADATVHGPDANAAIVSCQACHGADYSGGSSGRSCTECHATAGFADWRTNCTFCHGTQTQAWNGSMIALAAPPEGVAGETATTDRAVGAHRAHVQGVLTASMGCSECHATFPPAADLSHLGPAPAEVAFGTVATTGAVTPVYTPGAAPTCASTYCHGNFVGGVAGAALVWTETAALTCTSCHTAPAANAKPNSAWHANHVNGTGGVPAPVACARCHQGYTEATVNAASHVNGAAEAIVQPATGPAVRIVGWNCSDCHNALGI